MRKLNVKALATASAVFAALAVAIGIFGNTEGGRELFMDVRREVREALHLPKFWFNNYNVAVEKASELPCPKSDAIVLITGGQSNAANTNSSRHAGLPTSNSVMFYNGRCYRLADPVLGATGNDGSLWTELGTSLARRVARPVVMINGAVGGTQLEDWNDPRSGYLAHLLKQVKMARERGFRPTFVLWVQGETDAYVFADPKGYVASLKQLALSFTAAGFPQTEVPWIVYRSTRCKHRRGNSKELALAVTNFVETTPGFLLGPDANQLGDEYRRDQCHFNARGRAELVSQTLPILEANLSSKSARSAP